MKKSVEKNSNERPAQFNGLSEKEINTLYGLASIKKLQPGDILIKKGDIDLTFYVILSGKIRIGKGGRLLHPGDWVGGIDFVRQVPFTASAIAAEPSSVMAVNGKTLDALEAKTQLFFFKHLNNLVIEEISRLEGKQKKLVDKNIKLMKDIYRERTKCIADLQQHEIIQNVLKKVPKLPVFATTLANDLMGDRISSKEVSEQITKDPSLVGIVLKTINSAYYGFQKKISDIHHATVLLGFNQLYQLILAEGVRRTMPDIPSFHELHSHCVAMSHISFALSQETRIGKPVQLATIGLMHNLGQIVILLLKKQNPKLAIYIDSIDRAQIGGLLLKSWNLPDVVWKSIEFQFFPEFSLPNNIPEEIRNNVTILYISHLCYEIYQGKSEKELPTTFLDEYKQLLSLQKYSLADIANKHVLPNLDKNVKSLPLPLRQLIEKQIKS
ncbi:MAG: HDOD domain-containing protein [Deltaproteobacteria bacterium]|nr:HDOD domain-containing protein [Deltaproteobacteria bacterium]MBW2089958.1 HDOD domain-containing protein [Deltaproteobacteria bacterium]